MAAIFSALAYPLYRRLALRMRGRRSLASIATILIVFFGILLPLAGLLGIVTTQAIKVGGAITPWVQQQLKQPDALSGALNALPFIDQVQPYRDLILEKAGTLIGGISNFLIDRLQSFATGTFN